MKRQLSLLMLVSRSQLYRVLAILLAMAVLHLGAARWHMELLSGKTGSAVEIILDGFSRWVPGVAMMAIFACFGALGRRGGRVDYTWYRLPVSDWSRIVWPLAAGVLVFLVVWAVQLAAALGIMYLYSQVMPEQVHEQTLFLAAYRSGYFHGLLPLDDGGRLAATLFRYVGLGLYSGVAMIRSFRGKRTIFPLIAILAITLVVSPLGNYEWDVIVLGVLWFILSISIVQLPGREEEPGKEEAA